ncbi:MAG: 2-C-methyl-D-erythritol 4-phosphate cytidylyltransferase [Gammaproteobacteria bacterium CG_4_10_14_0_8_um_filter_38_16]|nr:MAG: 2-C-methyl-D-erythritol 4-phosphate cytidylyltransferase [Gammaproteobacteria bacterium CG_4_10_14_0_8_um_filter_38_16]PJA04366.1 MAG: 2-C-methyl-D-erythritol 4-phosphate cytidylyltransferase [Gammaproteobacteria bacterium CG_4_10_14_0_2_um_filter_38_22]PJB09555.1 MAG: 2-C-methyl-D-erythritol 4-phosphate cytidylyltransferase [Gammaproteobacteria bacterium CG_4_9_14_3_um_filter_38_9]
MKYFAIIPAAGIGLRVHADKPKQYLMLGKETILQRVVNLFASHAQIEKVIVVLHAQDHWWPTLKLDHPEKILTVIGGRERVHSVLLGLDFLADFSDKNDFVLVHDAARPCLHADDITHLLSELKDHQIGGLLGMPAVDTLKRISKNDEVIETISREQIWLAQTPQCFRFALLKKAIEKALSDNKIVTDESSAIELAGFKPKMILGNASNIKITFPEDLLIADKLL